MNLNREEKERLYVEVEHSILESYGKDYEQTERIVFETIYDERRRLETERDNERTRNDKKFYDRIQLESKHADPQQMREILRELIKYFFDGVVGHFDPRVYAFSTNLVPPAMTVLLNSMSPIRMVNFLKDGLRTLDDQLVIQGETEAFQRVVNEGTTIMVSTHQSNLDSILLGFALHKMNLPPFTYGAGLNLFSNKMISFFMHNLGAYKVDRRKSAKLYKDVLKTYAGCTLEFGHHNMFFPGGTRCRSGAVESKLKKGLLGMGLKAYIKNLNLGREKPDVFLVPCTLNYQLVLEAETLIDDHLKDLGKSRYIIEDDEFSKPKIVLDFVRKLFSLDSRIYLTVSKPLDVFGNEVDDQCRSCDKRGRFINRVNYVYNDGQVTFDTQRDKQYTEELSRSVVDAFHRDTVIDSTNLICYVAFNWLLENNPNMDLYQLLRTGGIHESISLPDMYRGIEETLRKIREMEQEGLIRLTPTLKENDVVMIANEALAHLKSFHMRPALERKGDRYFHMDRNLLLYYRNRLASFKLQRGEKPL